MMAMIGFMLLTLVACLMIIGGGIATLFVIGLDGSKFEVTAGLTIFVLGLILLNFACENAPFTLVMVQ